MFQGHDDLIFTEGKDYLVEGYCNLTIPLFPDEQSYPKESAIPLVETAEKGRSEFFKSLREIGANTIMLADHKKYGSHGMRHWELSCKQLRDTISFLKV